MLKVSLKHVWRHTSKLLTSRKQVIYFVGLTGNWLIFKNTEKLLCAKSLPTAGIMSINLNLKNKGKTHLTMISTSIWHNQHSYDNSEVFVIVCTFIVFTSVMFMHILGGSVNKCILKEGEMETMSVNYRAWIDPFVACKSCLKVRYTWKMNLV